jgi:hypothetical protein
MKSQFANPAVLSALAALALSSAAVAQTKPVTDENVTAKDVATTPASDLNLVKDDIPPVLLKAQDNPYATDGLKKCPQYASAIGELDAVLGPDVDVAGAKDGKLKPGQVAQSVVGSFIPFRGVIREVSGARKQQEAMRDAIVAGMMRRSFLKGMGLKLGCAYPARPADDAARKRLAALDN